MRHPNLYLIGLTGNIACGKSTVLAMLGERGAQVIDADQVTRDLQRPGEPVYEQIVAAFGAGILAEPGGPIDRRALGALVFNDPAALRQLELIVHPAVHARIQSWLEDLAQPKDEGGRIKDEVDARVHPSSFILHPFYVVVIDAIKLLEAGWKAHSDAIWVVTCRPEQQVDRLMATREMSEAEARSRIAAQPAQADKIAQADVVIDNSGSVEETQRQVEAAWRAIHDER